MQRLLLFAAILVCGCTPGPPLAPSTDTWTGTWRLLAVQASSQVTQRVPSGATYQVTFDGNRVSARVDCNVCSGTFATAGRTMTIGPALACTRAACQTATFESATVSVLAGEHTAWVAGTSLTLESGRGVILLER